MPKAGVHIECMRPPGHYSREQLDEACRIAYMLNRGKLALTIPPAGKLLEDDD